MPVDVGMMKVKWKSLVACLSTEIRLKVEWYYLMKQGCSPAVECQNGAGASAWHGGNDSTRRRLIPE